MKDTVRVLRRMSRKVAALETEQEEALVEARTAPVGGVFPVGTVFLSAVPTNPAELLGYGTWQELKGAVASVYTWERKA